MKEIYDWVRWFRELGGRIAEGGEAYLNEKARQMDWGENLARLEYGDEGIDPFSFFYFLASRAATNQLKTVYDSVSHEFAIGSPLPDSSVFEYYIFPTPQSRFSVFYARSDSGHKLLWRLFQDAVKDEPTINPINFENALKLKGVGVTKLTQTLFLINPNFFQPVDNITDDLSKVLELPTPSAIETDIEKEGGYEKYQTILGKLAQAFPGCQPYEVNMLLYLVRPNATNGIEVSGNYFHIGTHVYDEPGGDYWENRDGSFKENNWVYTGGPGSGKSWDEEGNYPLEKLTRGDIVLVRAGVGRGRAIGIVQKNDYADLGKNEDSRIHVLWINKSDEKLAKVTRQDALEKVEPHWKTLAAFKEAVAYRRSFDLIDRLSGNSTANEPESNPYDQQSGVYVMKNPHPLNQILYGPPGTGKTWNTVDYSLAIIEDEPLDVIEKRSREDKLRRFDELKAIGQIEMVTFHQNYNYEDFIEGIRPVLAGDAEGSVEYELSEGVFRTISERALDNRRRSDQAADESWDIDDLLEAFAEWIDERLDSNEQIDLNLIDRREGTKKIIGVNWSGDETFKSVSAGTEGRYLTRNVIKKYYKAFCNGEIKSKEDIKPTRNSKKPQHANARYYFALFQKIKEFQDNQWQPREPLMVAKQNYVLIIDEINRGNIAKIFGELITLIEPSKRIGADDETTATLPYSGEEFGVPDNLYIIGTMNTADRSIALLDTALRRRFDFVEMMPDPELVPDDVGGVDCRSLLEAMNERIRFLLDREHQIGHTYFMNIDDLKSLEERFKNRILPLLQEYFYDNWEKIHLVLNRNGFIKEREVPENLRGEQQLIDEEKKVYEFLPADNSRWNDPASYQSIYGGKPSPQEDTPETEPGS